VVLGRGIGIRTGVRTGVRIPMYVLVPPTYAGLGWNFAADRLRVRVPKQKVKRRVVKGRKVNMA